MSVRKTTPKRGAKPPPLALEERAVADVHPSPNNSRHHSPDQIDRLRASLDRFGWTKPIVVDEKGEILAGHGIYQAALQDGRKTVPVVVRRGLTTADKRAYRIADNKLAERSTWDDHTLGLELADLTSAGYDVLLTGFDQAEIDAMLAPPPPDAGEPEPAAVPADPISRLGDVWMLGDHRLICGDNGDPAVMDALMAGRQAQVVHTDPPYGVSYQAEGKAAKDVIKGDDKRRGALRKMVADALAQASKHTRADAAWYIWHASSTRDDFTTAMRDVGLVELAMIIWVKPSGVMGWSDYRWAHEPCFYAGRQGVEIRFYGDRTNTTVWHLQHGGIKGQPTSVGIRRAPGLAGWPGTLRHRGRPEGQEGAPHPRRPARAAAEHQHQRQRLAGWPGRWQRHPPNGQAGRARQARDLEQQPGGRRDPRPVLRVRIHHHGGASDRPPGLRCRTRPSLRRRRSGQVAGTHRSGGNPCRNRQNLRSHS